MMYIGLKENQIQITMKLKILKLVSLCDWMFARFVSVSACNQFSDAF